MSILCLGKIIDERIRQVLENLHLNEAFVSCHHVLEDQGSLDYAVSWIEMVKLSALIWTLPGRKQRDTTLHSHFCFINHLWDTTQPENPRWLDMSW